MIQSWARAALAALLLPLLAAPAASVRADELATAGFQARTFEGPQRPLLPYRLFVPRNLDPNRKYPLVLFLHGAGERGTDNQRQVRDILPWSREAIQAKYPCFIVAPQCPNWREVFQVYGYNTDLAVTAYRNYAGSEKQWKHFRVSPGTRVAGRTNWIFFFNDDWGKDTPVDSLFKNVRVYEAGQGAHAKALDFRKLPLTPYGGGGRGNNPTVEDDGATLHMQGDTRKKAPLAYTVTRNTVIEFDFKSTVQGNLHGIGLDDDDQIHEYKWVQVDWSAPSHAIPKEPSAPLKSVMELVPALEKEFPAIDSARLYVTGLSMGGFGAWDLLARRPDWFAAAVPICGGADLDTASTIVRVPAWVFHGGNDGTVRTDRSRNMVTALANLGGEPRYTEYRGVGHDSWTRAYAEPELLPWLFGQRRHTRPPPSPTGLKAALTGSARVDLSWTRSPDAADIKEYRVFRDGGEIGLTGESRFSDTEVAEGDVHSYTVVAVDRAWLRSAPSTAVWARLPADTSPLHIVAVQAQGSPYRVEVLFDKPVDPKSGAEVGNYKLDHGLSISAAVVLPDMKTVRLDTSQMVTKLDYALKVAGVTDRTAKRNPLLAATQTQFQYDPVLAAHWRLDEGEGQFSADATGNGNGSSGNVIAFHSVDWVPGKWGKALSFDGDQSHYAWTVQSRSLDLTDSVTVSFWVKKAAGHYGRQVMVTKSNYVDKRTQFTVELDPSHQVTATVGTLDRGDVVISGQRIDAREWHHIALTFSGGVLELYVDGVSQGTAKGGDRLVSVSEPVTIGAGHQGRFPFCGSLDEIRVYNRALSKLDINALAAADRE